MYFTNSQETWDSVCVLGSLSTLSFSLRSDLSSQGHTFGEPVFPFADTPHLATVPEVCASSGFPRWESQTHPFHFTEQPWVWSGTGGLQSIYAKICPAFPGLLEALVHKLTWKKTSPEPAVQCLDESKLLNWPTQGLWNRRTWEEGICL